MQQMSDTPENDAAPRAPRRGSPSWPAALAFLLAVAGGVGFGWAYVAEAANWWLGGFLALGFLGLGGGLVYWGLYLHPDRPVRGEYPFPQVDEAERGKLTEELELNQRVITRRRFLAVLLGGGAAVLGIGALFPVQSLGPLPGNSLFHTRWRKGSRLVTFDGKAVNRDALAPGSFLIVFPEGYADSAESQVALFRVPADQLRLPAGRESWTPDGFVAYSQICTHAGCPVTEYEHESQLLVCPCHESVFDILQGAKPLSGPSARALPQLPLMIDSNGYLAAQSDFEEAVGPGFWNLP
jgi:ubiquinol-cytochrome c reductase iron-sulfur subunit